jgi:hypothetical protein
MLKPLSAEKPLPFVNINAPYFGVCLTVLCLIVAAEGAEPVATATPPVLTIQQGGRAEFRCTVTGNPTPAIEWFGKEGCS